tara:strand:+ start:50 stop:340 length:291 start_codon:yes stop_codon:yes gene_type:complete
MNESQSIKETLSVIRKALEDDDIENIKNNDDNILFLNQLVENDGTINVLKKNTLTKKDTINLLNNKLDEVFETHLSKWLDINIPNYLEKYFNKKDI